MTFLLVLALADNSTAQQDISVVKDSCLPRRDVALRSIKPHSDAVPIIQDLYLRRGLSRCITDLHISAKVRLDGTPGSPVYLFCD